MSVHNVHKGKDLKSASSQCIYCTSTVRISYILVHSHVKGHFRHLSVYCGLHFEFGTTNQMASGVIFGRSHISSWGVLNTFNIIKFSQFPLTLST